MEKENERVASPKYYNSHPSGVECITIIRHYVCDIANAIKYMWRAGLKTEEGMSKTDKEIEDCEKALWYLRDYQRHCSEYVKKTYLGAHPSGIDCDTIASCYCDDIASAFRCLWFVGLVVDGTLTLSVGEDTRIRLAVEAIERHIEAIRAKK